MAARTSEGKRVVAIPIEADPDVRVFSPTKYRVMMLLKREGQSDLEMLSKKLSISQMAVYKHIRELESKGLVEHESKRIGVGRPRLVFRPSERSSGIFPSAYFQLASSAMETLERKLGKEAVADVLRQMQTATSAEYSALFGINSLEDKVKRLAAIKDHHGYMTEVVRSSKGELEIVEHNCPISRVSAKYPEACEEEREVMERVLRAKVQIVSSNPRGVTACRFKVSQK